jgi:hypothetical protein
MKHTQTEEEREPSEYTNLENTLINNKELTLKIDSRKIKYNQQSIIKI